MQIHIGSAIGGGPTKLAAFDTALNNIGIANYNLIRLSSVIPPESKVTAHEGRINCPMPGKWGDRLYVVMAEMRIDKPDAEVWAGIGWVQDEKTGQGLFVEHEGDSESEVRGDVASSLQALIATRGVDFGPIQMQVVGGKCTDKPLCAMVAAVYQASDWQNQPNFMGS